MSSRIIATLDDWKTLAQEIVLALQPGMILGLSGVLGSGKTTFVQYLAQELGETSAPKSPTFALLRTHSLTHPTTAITRLVHVDAYRLEREEDILPLNLEEELATPGTLVIIEWPEQVREWITRQGVAYREIQIVVEADSQGNELRRALTS
ncbi:MAG: tRNA (adenosine(37)-N6)-threonylcarbamoyltransferase complex ATPase subunit type 1 TsaE [Patescibacteria group bacterium]